MSKTKVKNATKNEYDGIVFRSKIETYLYRVFKEAGIAVMYEPKSYTLMEAFEFQGENIRAITYKPDFELQSLPIIIEVKGFANDAFPLRWKLFKLFCKKHKPDTSIFLVRNQKEVQLLLNFILDTYGTDSDREA